MGITEPWDKIVILADSSLEQGQGTPAVLLAKRVPFAVKELDQLRDLAEQGEMDLIYDPDSESQNKFSQLIRARNPEIFFQQYPLNVTPTTDDRPFFFFTLKWQDILSLWKTPSELQKNNAGLFMLLVTFVALLCLVGVFLVLPVVLSFKSQQLKLTEGLYFLAIGLGFMMTEVALIQKSILFVGHASHAFPIVVSALLAGGAWGSLRTNSISRENLSGVLNRWVLVAVSVLFFLSWVLPVWLRVGFSWPLYARVLWLSLPIAVVGSVLGRLFPLGLKRLVPKQIPWAWALNGGGSVLGSALAVMVAIEGGFRLVFWLAGFLYLIAFWQGLKNKGTT